MATIRISIINESKLTAPAEVQAAVAALQRQVSEHFAPAWGVDATLTFVAPGTKPPAGSWWLIILDDSDQAGALFVIDEVITLRLATGGAQAVARRHAGSDKE